MVWDAGGQHASLALGQGQEADAVRTRLRAVAPAFGGVHEHALEGEVMRIFKQTFAITYALESIGVVVALAGLGITLASILAEDAPS
jgi:putative ABC transport system permease protein